MAGTQWRSLAHDLPSWAAVYQQTRRWLKAACLEAMAHDLRMLLRLAARRGATPTAAIMDCRTLQSTPASGARAGYDGAKRRNGSKVHLAVDTRGHLLTLHVTPANEQDRAQVDRLARAGQEETRDTVKVAFVDQGYTGEAVAVQAQKHGIELLVVKHTEAKRGFVLLPRRWAVERSIGWAARFRRLACDYERLADTLAGLYYVAFVCLMLGRTVSLLSSGS